MSLKSLITGEDPARKKRYIFGEGKGQSKNVRTSNYVYYLYTAYDDIYPSETPVKEKLFDVNEDFRETHNISKEEPETAERLQEKLVEEFGVWGDLAEPEVQEEALRDRLKGLGYL